MICWRCFAVFEPSKDDIRPYFFHCCPDCVYAGHVNPFFNSWRRGGPVGVDSRSKGLRYDYKRRVYDK